MSVLFLLFSNQNAKDAIATPPATAPTTTPAIPPVVKPWGDNSGDDVADEGKFDSLVGDSDSVVVPVAVLAVESSDTVEVLEAVVVLDVVDSSSFFALSAARRSFRLIRQWTLSREAFGGGSQNVNFGQQASLVPSSRLVQGTEPSSSQTDF